MSTPAFPCKTANDTESTVTDPFGLELPPNSQANYVGMHLRDYFADGAMRAFIATCPSNCLNGLHGHEDQTATAAYRMADAMLKARGAA